MTRARHCPDCEGGELPHLVSHRGLWVQTCAACGAAWPTIRQQQELLASLGLERELEALVEHRVYCRWVPGTMDTVEMWLASSGERREVKADWVRQQVGHRAVDELYLNGKTEFGCDLTFWQRAAGPGAF